MLTVKELQEWEHYDEFIKLRLEENSDNGETTEEFLTKVKKGSYSDLAQVVICTARFSTLPDWRVIWQELVYEQG